MDDKYIYLECIVLYQEEVLLVDMMHNNTIRTCFPIKEREIGESKLQAAIRICYELTGVIVTQNDYVNELKSRPLKAKIGNNEVSNGTIYALVFRIKDKQKIEMLDSSIKQAYFMRLSQLSDKKITKNLIGVINDLKEIGGNNYDRISNKNE